jgi:hypothetical protein
MDFLLNERMNVTASLSASLRIARIFIERSHKPLEAKFVTSPLGAYPLAQIALSPSPTRPIDEEALLERASAGEFETLDLVERRAVLDLVGLPLFCPFSEPLQSLFSYDWSIFNSSHPVAIGFLRAAALAKLLAYRKTPGRDLELVVQDCSAALNRGFSHVAIETVNPKMEAVGLQARALGLTIKGELAIAPSEVISRSLLISKACRFGEPYSQAGSEGVEEK